MKSSQKKYLTKLIFFAQKIVHIAVIRVNALLCFILGKIFSDLYGKDYDSGMHFSSLIGSIKIDFATFLEFQEKYKLRKLLEKLEAEEPDEETKKKIYKAMDIDGNGLISEFEFKEWSKKILQVNIDTYF